MFKTLLNIFRIPELRNKVLFTIGLLCVYRIGFYVPLPGVDANALLAAAKANSDSAFGVLSGYMSMFSGGALNQSTIFGLGIMPYISASIILQLLSTVLPQLEALRKEGEPGMRKINEWTRYLTVAICVIQAGMWLSHLQSSQPPLLYGIIRNNVGNMWLFWLMGLATLTAGSLFLMWLGEQIDQFGIGNGVSLIITAGIVSRMPTAIWDVIQDSPFSDIPTNWTQYGPLKSLQMAFDVQNQSKPYNILTMLFLIAAFIIVVGGSILLTQAQRRIKIQQAKHMRGRRVYGGTAAYLPLRVNHAGVMPIIFASSLMIFPGMVATWLTNLIYSKGSAGASSSNWQQILVALIQSFHQGLYLYELMYIGMIFFFSYFWNTVQFNPKEMANQLRDYGSFIPGLRPGKRTAEYLENVMIRITYVGATFLCLIAVIPTLIATFVLGGGAKAYQISQFLGGTGLLIVISVMLDVVNRIEANLVMRNYGGFLETGAAGNRLKNRIRGPVGRTPAPDKNDGNSRGIPA
ncbi:MAG: preprotein translocase subunit SecY [Phycisphaerae bacterium]